jgi:hypothetical protein
MLEVCGLPLSSIQHANSTLMIIIMARLVNHALELTTVLPGQYSWNFFPL